MKQLHVNVTAEEEKSESALVAEWQNLSFKRPMYDSDEFLEVTEEIFRKLLTSRQPQGD